MKLNDIAAKNSEFVEWIVKNIAKEMSAKKRMRYACALADIVGGNKMGILREVEGKTKAKDEGYLIELIDGMDKPEA